MSKWVKMKPDKAVRYSLGVPKTMVMEPGMHLTARVPPGGVELVATSAIGGQIFWEELRRTKHVLEPPDRHPTDWQLYFRLSQWGKMGRRQQEMVGCREL